MAAIFQTCNEGTALTKEILCDGQELSILFAVPTLLKTQPFHAPAGFQNGGFFATTVLVNGAQRAVNIFVDDSKADKHLIDGKWPAKQGYAHTGITISDDEFRPLYERFGIDFAARCAADGNASHWYEFRYTANELPTQHYFLDVDYRDLNDMKQLSSIKVGASVLFNAGSGYAVLVNHGPY